MARNSSSPAAEVSRVFSLHTTSSTTVRSNAFFFSKSRETIRGFLGLDAFDGLQQLAYKDVSNYVDIQDNKENDAGTAAVAFFCALYWDFYLYCRHN